LHDARVPQKRRDFLWRTNGETGRAGVLTLMLPFTHRLPATILEPGPTDDTEFALLTLFALAEGPDAPTQESLLAPWLARVLPDAEGVRGGFAERAALRNLAAGLRPPATGNDNPQHYSDSAAARGVVCGLFVPGNPERAAAIAALDAQITHAEDGIYGAQAMAAAASVLAGGGDLAAAITAARAYLPPESWIAHNDARARSVAARVEADADLALLLTREIINTVYSYGNAAPETVPAALVIVEQCGGDLDRAIALANAIPKAADSLPALVGALCGAWRGPAAVTPLWRAALNEVRGLALPFLAGVRLQEAAQTLAQRINVQEEKQL
jgi:ADP-ribosylglycohydrolase